MLGGVDSSYQFIFFEHVNLNTSKNSKVCISKWDPLIFFLLGSYPGNVVPPGNPESSGYRGIVQHKKAG